MDLPVIVEVWSVDSLAECLDAVGAGTVSQAVVVRPCRRGITQREGYLAPAYGRRET